jgi:hypothetical protein
MQPHADVDTWAHTHMNMRDERARTSQHGTGARHLTLLRRALREHVRTCCYKCYTLHVLCYRICVARASRGAAVQQFACCLTLQSLKLEGVTPDAMTSMTMTRETRDVDAMAHMRAHTPERGRK